MKAYTDEVWVVPAGTQALWAGGWSFYDTHAKGRIYYKGPKDRFKNRKPLYIALRAGGQVRTIQRVMKIEHEVKPIAYLPELRHVKHQWPNEPSTIWHLSEPTLLPKPIPTGDRWMRARHVVCDLDVLLSCTSIKNAEERMHQRRVSELH